MKQQTNKTYRIAILGILTAILIIQNFVPLLGNIPIPPLNPTIIHITVIVATLVLGTRDGILIGVIWGVIRMIKAYTIPSSPLDLLLWTNPLIAIVPRALIGLFAGLVYQSFRSRQKERTGMIAASVVGSLTNTVFVLAFIALLYGKDYAAAINVDPSGLMTALLGIVATSGIAEAIAAAVIAPFIAKALLKVKRK